MDDLDQFLNEQKQEEEQKNKMMQQTQNMIPQSNYAPPQMQPQMQYSQQYSMPPPGQQYAPS